MVQALLPAPSKPNINAIRADSYPTLHFLTRTHEATAIHHWMRKPLKLTERLFDDTLLSKAC
jgi:hypothetical protein